MSNERATRELEINCYTSNFLRFTELFSVGAAEEVLGREIIPVAEGRATVPGKVSTSVADTLGSVDDELCFVLSGELRTFGCKVEDAADW